MMSFMVTTLTAEERVRRLRFKTKWARKKERRTQQEIADILGITRTAYSKYESRSEMPGQHVLPFCRITRIDPKWFLDPHQVPPEYFASAVGKPTPSQPGAPLP